MKKNWWKEKEGFFGEFYEQGDDSLEGSYYERSLSREQRTNEEVDGIIKLCELKDTDNVLDCPTGWGRHAIELSKRGLKVTGVDLNSYELKLAKKNAKKKKLKIDFVKKDMRNIRYDDTFDAVINLWYSFGFFENEKDNVRSLKNFYNALKPNGKFLMHTHKNVPWIISGESREYEKRELKRGGFLRQIEFYESESKRNYGIWIIEKNGKVEMREYFVRLYTKEEFTEMCQKVGFKRVDFYSDWSGNEYSPKIRTMIAVATK